MTALEENTIFVGSGNVFKDLGFPNAEERLQKSELLKNIHNKIADILDIDRSYLHRVFDGIITNVELENLEKLNERLEE